MSFGTAKFVLHIISLIGWLLVVLGVIILIVIFSGSTTQIDQYEQLVLLVGPSLSLIVVGILIVANSQMGFAIIATAENTAETTKNTAKILSKIQSDFPGDPPLRGF